MNRLTCSTNNSTDPSACNSNNYASSNITCSATATAAAAPAQQNDNGQGENSGDLSAQTLAAFTNTILNVSKSSFIHCADCGMQKPSLEDLEVHIKTEHLLWLPFECPECSVLRATDHQMWEHLHSAHRSSLLKFHYNYNAKAKRDLQNIMGLSLLKRITMCQKPQPLSAHSPAAESGSVENHQSDIVNGNKIQEDSGNSIYGITTGNDSIHAFHNLLTLCGRNLNSSLNDQKASLGTPLRKRRKSSSIGKTNTDAILSAINAATNPEISEFIGDGTDHDAMFSINDLLTQTKDVRNEICDMRNSDEAREQDPNEILGNVVALFKDDSPPIRRRTVANVGERFRSSTNSVSKKRILGLCSKCNKPVTAGARQMHMFYHLAKDYQIYRFRCMYKGCKTEHYRKDQMENHQSKFHGKIDASLMEDKTSHLFSACQDLSMKLLGTTGNVPGPTAEVAQAAYNESIATQALNQNKKRIRHVLPVMDGKSLNFISNGIDLPSTSNAHHFTPKSDCSSVEVLRTTVTPDGSIVNRSQNDDGISQCQICEKFVKNKLRSFHILGHLTGDVGNNRYACQFCDFTHHSLHSVLLHSKREHGDDGGVEDRLQACSKDIQALYTKCFGYQDSTATQEFLEKEKDNCEVASNDSFACSSSSALLIDDSEAKKNENDVMKVDPKEDFDCLMSSSSSISPQSLSMLTPTKSSKLRTRRFGMRKAASREKRKEMALLREKSIKIGGAQYIKKRSNEIAKCEKCSLEISTRLTHHAHSHLNENLFLCPVCGNGGWDREMVIRHIRESHNSTSYPVDDRIAYAKEIKEVIRECFSEFFVDAPLPTAEDLEKLLRKNGEMSDIVENGQVEAENVIDDDRASPNDADREVNSFSNFVPSTEVVQSN